MPAPRAHRKAVARPVSSAPTPDVPGSTATNRPGRPYRRGAASVRLILCRDCECFMPLDHDCSGTPPAE